MSANKLFLLQNPPTVLNNNISSASENTSLYTQRGQYNSIVRFNKDKGIDKIDLGTLYSDEFRLSTMIFVEEALIKTLCSQNISLGKYSSGEYTISNINNINLLIKELKSKNSTLNFPRLNII